MNASGIVGIFYALLLTFVLASVADLIFITIFIARLRESHHDVYVELGEPSLLPTNNIKDTLRLIGFLVAGRFLRLNDRSLSPLGNLCRVLLIIGWTSFAISWVLSAIYWRELHM